MKLDNLLAPYLYQYKKLNLPGIGTFEADISTVVPEDNDKHQAPVQGITFKQQSSPEPDNELIEYIKAQTGKMKPLAIADLESYLMLVKQFLNIGKPFYIEGIGTLQKLNDGSYKFTPGEYISPRLDNGTQESSTAANRKAKENRNTDPGAGRSGARKAMLTLAVIATIAVIGWGSYYFYKMNTREKEEALPVNIVTPIPDTSHTTTLQPDSSQLMKDTAAARKDTTAKIIVDTTARAVRTDTTVHKARSIKAFRKVKPVKADSIPATDSTSN